MTWMTPLLWKTSAVVTVAMPPFSSVSMILPLYMVAVSIFALDSLGGWPCRCPS